MTVMINTLFCVSMSAAPGRSIPGVLKRLKETQIKTEDFSVCCWR